MNPDHLQLAILECEDLILSKLIEPSNWQWACGAFYVNKQTEQVRGKMRLVINYKRLNHFLKDNKFLHPTQVSLFYQIINARWSSKFDLKYGFGNCVFTWIIDTRHDSVFLIIIINRKLYLLVSRQPRPYFKRLWFESSIYSFIWLSCILIYLTILNYIPKHLQLLSKFVDIIREYEIMRSNRKMVLV